ncbi:TnsA endonuclease N-terminal domain-containing protein [Amphritea balenae]|uniref:TnsA endonuclease N-terminal domain-containing protein n=1 Tax=Amphritea balenae TaxID=452629 RepID=A0A3P1SML6_9GAMM|nr:TnsA endonuclease N-terminal domain-containing protein [Amphritea balenae]RRC98270.1 hypothetical protein EHS89_14355 [Amphritea balenae]GGK80539.1 hypothetical protein GCM10007941_33640 [Amphritea balenae]
MRLIAKHSPIRPTRQFWSHKNQTIYFMESGLEREFALRCEFDPQVISYRCQIDSIYYSLPGETRRRRYTPDTLMEHAQMGLTAIEVKPERYTLKPIILAKHARLQEIYAEQNTTFLVLTEHDIRNRYLTSNYSNLYRFLRFEIDIAVLQELKAHFPNGMTLEEVRVHPARSDAWMSTAYQAIAHNIAITDLTPLISNSTQLEWTQ